MLGTLKTLTMEAKRKRTSTPLLDFRGMEGFTPLSWVSDFLRLLREIRSGLSKPMLGDFEQCGPSLLLCDKFDVFVSTSSGSASRGEPMQIALDAYCVLFKDIIVLCRRQDGQRTWTVDQAISVFGLLYLKKGSNTKLGLLGRNTITQLNHPSDTRDMASQSARHSFKLTLGSFQGGCTTLSFTSTRLNENFAFHTCWAWTAVVNYILQHSTEEHAQDHTLLAKVCPFKILVKCRDLIRKYNFE